MKFIEDGLRLFLALLITLLRREGSHFFLQRKQAVAIMAAFPCIRVAALFLGITFRACGKKPVRSCPIAQPSILYGIWDFISVNHSSSSAMSSLPLQIQRFQSAHAACSPVMPYSADEADTEQQVRGIRQFYDTTAHRRSIHIKVELTPHTH